MLKSTIKHKNVEFTELFYDLVFVYAISKTTELIHHLHDGVVGGEAFFAFIITTFVPVDAWMLQTVFTNQYGKNSFLNLSYSITARGSQEQSAFQSVASSG